MNHSERRELEEMLLRLLESVAGRPLTTAEKLDARYLVGVIIGVPRGEEHP